MRWGYGEDDGPAAWGRLDPAYAMCSLGTEQSPIDLTDAQEADLPPVEFDYGPARSEVEDAGPTLQVNPAPGHGVVVDGVRYELEQFHFHRPSEHLVNGAPFAMELHLVHRDGEGGLLVVGVLLRAGESCEALAGVWEFIARPRAVADRALVVHLPSLLPDGQATWRYRGSLTTPPCDEGVAWVILAGTLSVSPEQIEAFAAKYGCNCRPVQPLGERILLFG